MDCCCCSIELYVDCITQPSRAKTATSVVDVVIAERRNRCITDPPSVLVVVAAYGNPSSGRRRPSPGVEASVRPGARRRHDLHHPIEVEARRLLPRREFAEALQP